MLINNTSVVFNESSIDSDFRVESNTSTHMLFVDGGNNRVGIGTSYNANYDASLQVVASNTHNFDDFTSNLVLLDDAGAQGGSGGHLLFAGNDGSSSRGFCKIVGGKANSTSGNYAGQLSFKVRANGESTLREAFRINTSEAVFNETSQDADFRVESNGNTHMLFVDAGNDSVNIAGSSDPSKGNLVVTGSANSAAASHRPAILSRGSFGGGIASIDSLESGWYQITSGTIWNLYHGRDTSSDTPASKIVQTFNSGETVFNESSRDLDFRVESDANTHMLFVDAGNSKVNIGTGDAPHGVLTVANSDNGTEAAPQMAIRGAASNYTLSFFLDGTAAYIGQNSASRNLRLYSGAETAGVNLANGGTSFGTFSDERLKENIQDIGSVTEKIKDIRCVTFNRIDVEDAQETIGFIAQDFIGKFDQVLDESKVLDSDEETRYSIRYTETIPILMKAIQEQQTQIEALQSEINLLKGE
jgi:hypothetical protein